MRSMDGRERVMQLREGKEITLSMATYSELVHSVNMMERAIARMSTKMTQFNAVCEAFGEELCSLKKRIVILEVDNCSSNKRKNKRP